MLATASQLGLGLGSGSSTAVTGKRPVDDDERDGAPALRRQRAVGGFLDDSDEEDEAPQELQGSTDLPPPAKKRMLEHNGSETETAAATTTTTADEPEPEAQLLVEEEDRYDLLFRSRPDRMVIESLEPPQMLRMQTCAGKTIPIRQRAKRQAVPYETMVAARSRTKEGRATRSYYGINIHELVDGAQKELKEKEKTKAEKEKTTVDKGTAPPPTEKKKRATMLWTEKYRARSFMDLVGDDLTNRLVLRWLKRWDPIVFPHAAKARRRPTADEEEKPHRKILILTGPPGLGKTTLAHVCARQAGYEVLEINASDERSRDVVNGRIRTSLGTESVKTVEQVSRVKGKEKEAKEKERGKGLLATSASQAPQASVPAHPVKVARPVCVVVDEVDGVVGGSGGSGEGGFVKALIDLVLVDQRNSGSTTATTSTTATNRRKKDDFRQMRPLILICNDVYHPALRPLRQSGLAEVVHVGKPSTEAVVARLKSVFEKEGIACEKEAARKLCEAAWGSATNAQEARRGAESTAEGDLRGVMVVGEWVARRLRQMTDTAKTKKPPQLTRQWVDRYVLPDMAYGSGGGGGVGARGLGRGGTREIVTRIFQEGAGFPQTAIGANPGVQAMTSTYRLEEQPREQMGFAEHQRRLAVQRLREMIETSGEVDRIVTDVFAEFPGREFNDDLYLSKPDAAYEWLHFHDQCARRVFGSQEWELAPYTSQPVLACHELFASSRRVVEEKDKDGAAVAISPLAGPRADFAAREAEKTNRAALQAIQAALPPSLLRALRSAEDVAVDFLPYLVRLVSPDVKPVLVHVSSGSDKNDKNGRSGTTSVASVRREGEKVLVHRAAEVLAELGISLRRGMLEEEQMVPGRSQWVYRMEPDIDMLASFETAGASLSGAAPTRYAVRQVLDQELRKTLAAREMQARQARFQAGRPMGSSLVERPRQVEQSREKEETKEKTDVKRDFFGRVIVSKGPQSEADSAKARAAEEIKVWVTFHEGLNNAVRKPMTVEEFLRGL